MFAECKTWEKPVRVRKVDVKEGDAAAAAAAAESDDDADPTGAGSNPTDGAQVELTPELLGMELLVGKVVSVEKHPDAGRCTSNRWTARGRDGPRTICSGLVPYMSPEDILGKNVVVVANLKPRNMAGIKSAGMLLCANDGGDGDNRKVELLVAPEEAPSRASGSRGVARRTTRRTARIRWRRRKSGRRCSRISSRGELRGDVERDAARILRRRASRMRVAQGWRNLVSDDARKPRRASVPFESWKNARRRSSSPNE